MQDPRDGVEQPSEPPVRRVRFRPPRPGDPSFSVYVNRLADQLDQAETNYGHYGQAADVAADLRSHDARLREGKFLYGDRVLYEEVVEGTVALALRLLNPRPQRPVSIVHAARAAVRFGQYLEDQKRHREASRRPVAVYVAPRRPATRRSSRPRSRARTFRRASRGLISRPDDDPGPGPGSCRERGCR